MKKVFMLLAMMTVSASAAMASTIETSSKNPNPAFPKTAAEILKLDQKAVRASKALGNDEMGDLYSYQCTAEVDADATPSSLQCTFIHNLPEGMCWYGSYELKYSLTRGAEGGASITQRWIKN